MGPEMLRFHGISPVSRPLRGLRLLQTVLVLGVGWLSDLYGVGSTIFAGALVQACAGLPLFMALQAAPRMHLYTPYEAI